MDMLVREYPEIASMVVSCACARDQWALASVCRTLHRVVRMCARDRCDLHRRYLRVLADIRRIRHEYVMTCGYNPFGELVQYITRRRINNTTVYLMYKTQGSVKTIRTVNAHRLLSGIQVVVEVWKHTDDSVMVIHECKSILCSRYGKYPDEDSAVCTYVFDGTVDLFTMLSLNEVRHCVFMHMGARQFAMLTSTCRTMRVLSWHNDAHMFIQRTRRD